MNDWDKIKIHGWMFNKLELKGNDLIVFALVWSDIKNQIKDRPLSQSKWYAQIMGVAESTVRHSLNWLRDKGYIVAQENYSEDGNHFVNYYSTLDTINVYLQATADYYKSLKESKEEEKD